MKKISLLLIIILIGKFSTGQNNIYQCSYIYSHWKDSTNASTKVIEYMNLDITSTGYKYYSSQRQIGYQITENDKIVQTPLENIMKNMDQYYVDAESEIIFFENKMNIYKLYDKLSSKSEYKSIDSLGVPKWQLKKDTITILGQLCQKAVTYFRGRNYNAWFANKIPFNVGPYKFVGLPGLILRISDDKGRFKFECTELNSKKIRDFKLYANCKNVTYKKLKELKKLRIVKKKLFMDMEYANVNVSINGANTINTKRIDEPYNPIELSQ